MPAVAGMGPAIFFQGSSPSFTIRLLCGSVIIFALFGPTLIDIHLQVSFPGRVSVVCQVPVGFEQTNPWFENVCMIGGRAFMTSLDTEVRETTAVSEGAQELLIQKREVTRILNRACEDPRFCEELMEKGIDALDEYQLSHAAKAAIASGDLQWLNDNVGELTQKQLLFIYKRHGTSIW